MTIPEIFTDIKNNYGYGLESITKMKTEFKTNTPPFRNNDTAVIKSFLNGLNRIDIQGQINNCEIHLETLQSNKEEAILEYNQKSKFYVSMGILSGIFLIIVFI